MWRLYSTNSIQRASDRCRNRSQTAGASQAARLDVFVTVHDTGLRPNDVFRMRVENIKWSDRAYFNASGKTKRSRRWVALSQRVLDLLSMRCGGWQEGLGSALKAQQNRSPHDKLRKRFGSCEKLRGCLRPWYFTRRSTLTVCSSMRPRTTCSS
jgi:integrase